MATMQTTSDVDSYWRDRFYPTSHVKNLPRDIRLTEDVCLTLNYARLAEVTSSLMAVVNEAAQRGDNVGMDEYDEVTLQNMIEFAEIFIARWSASSTFAPPGAIAAFIVIRPSDYVRTIDPRLADLRIFRSRDVSDSAYYRLVDLSVQLTAQLDCGYRDCIMAVATTCHGLLGELIGRQKFEPIVTVPHTVNMVRGLGLVDSVLLHKNFDSRERLPRSRDQVLAMLAKHGIKDGDEDDAAFSKVRLREAPFLPQKVAIGHKQVTLVVRNMRKEDERVAFDAMTATVDLGEGYPLHSYPNLAWFRRALLSTAHCVVFEHNGAFVGFYAVYPAPMARSPSANSCQGVMVIDKPFQDQSLGKHLGIVNYYIAINLGYQTAVEQMVANNIRQQKNTSIMDRIGIVPKAGYIMGTGRWIDRVILYMSLTPNGATPVTMSDLLLLYGIVNDTLPEILPPLDFSKL